MLRRWLSQTLIIRQESYCKRKDNTSITGWDNFTSGSGLKVAAQTGTYQADIANQLSRRKARHVQSVILNRTFNTSATEMVTLTQFLWTSLLLSISRLGDRSTK